SSGKPRREIPRPDDDRRRRADPRRGHAGQTASDRSKAAEYAERGRRLTRHRYRSGYGGDRASAGRAGARELRRRGRRRCQRRGEQRAERLWRVKSRRLVQCRFDGKEVDMTIHDASRRTRWGRLALLAALTLAAGPAAAICSTTWIGGVDSNFGTAGNWSTA